MTKFSDRKKMNFNQNIHGRKDNGNEKTANVNLKEITRLRRRRFVILNKCGY